MNTQEILTYLQKEIHSTVFATVDENGLPQTCVIDLMLLDEQGLYFLTAKGKRFYQRLIKQKYVSLTGMKGKDTRSTISISLQGKIKSIGQEKLEDIFEMNPYMNTLYPTQKSRETLEVFCIYQAQGEYFDLGQNPVYRQNFAYGNATIHETGYQIDQTKCIGCQGCRSVCPSQCISKSRPRVIDRSHCLHCGNCYRVCPVNAVQKLEV
ncbi:4Fe-4S binding protein [Faecalicoccus pleomorphus]|uniref:4Fe-4S binding protein n=1 Tax=Faecalicoccus pleomorphus TaxID=1323 RepID=UPI0024314C1D|nr:4Fe-4S binding protein [Faecalicoccus pleomorphus]